MNLFFRQLMTEKANLATQFANISVTSLILFMGLVLLLPVSDGLSLSIVNYLDINELVILSDSLLAECLGVSFLSLLMVNPLLIDRLLCFIQLFCKFINKLGSTRFLSTLFPLLFNTFKNTAHGCRAPPI